MQHKPIGGPAEQIQQQGVQLATSWRRKNVQCARGLRSAASRARASQTNAVAKFLRFYIWQLAFVLDLVVEALNEYQGHEHISV